jgi:hypothetical protein
MHSSKHPCASRTAELLAAATSAQADRLYRVPRALASVGVLAALLVGCSGGHHRAAPPKIAAPTIAPSSRAAMRPRAAPTGPSAPRAILTRHLDSDGVLDLEGVLELFSYAVAPLPGVTVASGSPDSTGDWGELALEAIPPHLHELSPAQRDVVLPYYQPGPGTRAWSLDTVPGPRAMRRAGYVVLAAFIIPPVPPPAAPSLDVQKAIVDSIRVAVPAEAAKLGHSLGDAPTNAKPGAVHVVFAAADLQAANGGTAPAWTLTSHGPVSSDGKGEFTGSVTDCTIFIGPTIWAHWGPTPRQVAQMYHEVFHCYQGFVTGHFTAAVAYTLPLWVSEGGADWAAASITGYDEPAFGAYLGSPDTTLARRAYDAVGFYFELEYLGRPLWPEWWQIWTSAAIGGWSTTEWFNAVSGTGYSALTQAWGASFYQDPKWGKAWDVTAPHQTARTDNTPTGFTGGEKTVAALPYATSQVVVFPEPAGTAVAISATGTTRLIDGTQKELVNASTIVLCWDDCSCPSDSQLASSLYHVQGQVKWAMTSLGGGAQALFQSVPIGDVCKAKKNSYPAPPAPPCPSTCPGSNGDPHITTVNLRRLEFQTPGEFVLLRSADGSLEVQARQEPIAGGSVGATINTAVALRLGAHRVSAYPKDDAVEARVDGRVATSTTDLGRGGRLVVHSNGVEVDVADGTTVSALRAGSGLYVVVLPSADLRDHGVGVLARIPPGAALPALPDGTTLPYATAAADVYDFRYGRFADAWRVTDRTSLFDYDRGKSTASYTVAGFIPELGSAHPMVLDPTARVSADSTCGAVLPVELHDDCVFDVAVTGRKEFVAGYTAAATFRARGAAALDEGQQAPPTAPTVRATPGSTQLLADVMGMSGSVLAPDGTVYATVQEGTPGNHMTELLAIDPVAAKVRARAKLDATAGAATGVAAAGGAVWVVASDFTSTGTSCRVVRLDATSLQAQAKVPLQVCPSAAPAIAAAGGAVWVQQPVGGSGAQGELWRIDPSTNQIASKVAVPNGELIQAGAILIGGALQGSPTAVFWSNGPAVYRVRAPWSTAEDLHAGRGGLFPAGDALVVETMPGTANVYGGQAQGAALALPGRLVGADATQLYATRPGTDGSTQLWREGLSGETPALAAEVPQGTPAPWTDSYDPRSPVLFAGNVLLTVAPQPRPGGSLALYLDVVPLR